MTPPTGVIQGANIESNPLFFGVVCCAIAVTEAVAELLHEELLHDSHSVQ